MMCSFFFFSSYFERNQPKKVKQFRLVFAIELESINGRANMKTKRRKKKERGSDKEESKEITVEGREERKKNRWRGNVHADNRSIKFMSPSSLSGIAVLFPCIISWCAHTHTHTAIVEYR